MPQRSSDDLLRLPVLAQRLGCRAEPGIILDDAAGLAGCLRIDRERKRAREIKIAFDPNPNGSRTEAISDRLNEPSSGQPKPRSARPNYVE